MSVFFALLWTYSFLIFSSAADLSYPALAYSPTSEEAASHLERTFNLNRFSLIGTPAGQGNPLILILITGQEMVIWSFTEKCAKLLVVWYIVNVPYAWRFFSPDNVILQELAIWTLMVRRRWRFDEIGFGNVHVIHGHEPLGVLKH